MKEAATLIAAAAIPVESPKPATIAVNLANEAYQLEINQHDIRGQRFQEDRYEYHVAQAYDAVEREPPDYRQAYEHLLRALYLSDVAAATYQITTPHHAGHTVIRAVQLIVLGGADDAERLWQWRFDRARADARRYLNEDCSQHRERRRWELVIEAKSALRTKRTGNAVS